MFSLGLLAATAGGDTLSTGDVGRAGVSATGAGLTLGNLVGGAVSVGSGVVVRGTDRAASGELVGSAGLGTELGPEGADLGNTIVRLAAPRPIREVIGVRSGFRGTEAGGAADLAAGAVDDAR